VQPLRDVRQDILLIAAWLRYPVEPRIRAVRETVRSVALMYNEIRMLLRARDAGASFESMLTVGRQSLFLHRNDVAALDSEFGLPRDAVRAARAFGGPAEDFLRAALEVRALHALDVSDYEGADLLHDLNHPAPSSLDQRFDAVVDGGSLEHVFNFPVALANVMRLTKAHGRVFVSLPANNLCGHGFYQVSPELVFRAFGERQGFALRGVWLVETSFPGVELTSARRVVEVADPDQVAERVGLVTRRPVMLLASAEKLRHIPEPFAAAPQQSDYVARWREHRRHGPAVRSPGVVTRLLPRTLRLRLRGHRQRLRFSLRNQRFYRAVS
jgi:SAM-dependent methyltransferase